MMTLEEYNQLLDADLRCAIAANRGRDPLQVALDRTIPHPRVVATQVKYLDRAAQKLPSYAAAGCIIPPLAFEQASSEACAAHKTISGDTVLDLTCGLGVDTLFLSRRFRRVVSLERNAMLAQITTENLRRLGVANVEVLCTSAEEYLAQPGLTFDWVYADPDRRSASGRKLVRLEECSPNLLALMPLIERTSGHLCIKNSPLFDVDEALRLFPTARVEVLSLDDECKEVVIYVDGAGPSVTATVLSRGGSPASPCASILSTSGGLGVSFTATPRACAPAHPSRFDPEAYHWLVIPDVALQKARLARQSLAGKADMWSENGYGFSTTEPRDVIGRVLALERIEPYDPRALKRELRGRGVTLFKRDFPFAIEEVMRRLGAHAGADVRLALTKIDGGFWTIRIK